MTDDTIAVEVARKWIEATDICGLELVDIHRRELPEFSPGSHIDLYLPGGFVRQYSLCNDPLERHRYHIGILKDPNSRGGSHRVHERVREGDLLRISNPRNHFQLAQAKQYLMFAGGIGITPILCMAEQLARAGADFVVHYCARSRDRMAFTTRIERSAFRSSFCLHFDDGEEEQKLKIDDILLGPSIDKHLYVCGPAGFMNRVIDSAKDLRWENDCIHREYFASNVANPGGDSFEVELASGRILLIPSDRSVAAVLRENDIDVPLSCEAGVCGTCLTRVLSGQPDHRDVFLTDEEHARNDQFTPCCSRSLSRRLVLDL
jgi:vanillate O-demethylase ferredoxin subunit